MALSFATMNRMETSIQCLSLNQRLFESEYESQLIEILKKEYVCDRPHTLICLGIHDEMCGFPEVILRNNNRLRHSKCLADVKDWIQDLILKNNNIVNMRDCLGLAPLHLICSLHSPGQMEILKIFLTQELCHANALDGLSRTPLHHALSPANLKYHSKSDDQGESLVNIVSLLIKYGANANATECHGITPLHLALDYYKSGSANELQKLPELIKTLLEGGASLNLRAPSGYESLAPIPKSLTPLHLACRLSGRPSLDVLSLLVSPDYINTTDHLMKTPLHELLSVKKIKKMPQELTFSAPCNFILEKVELLIENGADVNAKDSEGMTPLLVALENPNHDYCGQLVKILLEKGADPNVRIAQSRVSPLHLACKYLNDELIELVPLFLNAGARLNTLDYNHLTPFHYALLRRPTSHFSSHHYLNVATLRSLVRYQADPTLNDVQGNSSIHMVCVSPNRHLRDVVAFLIREGCKINQINKQGNTPLLYFLQNKFNRQSIQTLIDLGADCRVINNEGISALHLVSRSLVYQDDVDEIVEVILKGGADVNTRDLDGNTPLHYAVRDESTTNIKAIRKLLLAGANLNIKNSEGMTPLHIVSSNGSHYLAKMFLNFGADVNVKDNLGNTPLHIAQAATENGSAMSRVLLENGANLSAENSRGATPFVIMSLNTHRFMIGYTVLMIEKRKYILNDKETKLLEHNRIFRKRYHNCYSCVLAMKDCFIGNSFVTLLEFLLAKNECAMRYARNPKIVNDLTHFADSARYRWYSDMIREKLSEVLFLKTLIDRSSRSLRIICYPFRLPDLVIDQVLSFLDDDDMNSLNRAVFQNP